MPAGASLSTWDQAALGGNQPPNRVSLMVHTDADYFLGPAGSGAVGRKGMGPRGSQVATGNGEC